MPAALPLQRSKWAATLASVWIQCACGSSYTFGIYSPLLKASQNYDQSTLDSVAFFKDAGANIGVLSGLLMSSRIASRRPWVVLAAGAAQNFVGYFFMWLSVIGAVPRPRPVLMCLYMFLGAHAQTFFNTANVVVAVENFPQNRGTGIGIMKGFLGLSGAILIQIYRAVLNGNPSSFMLMLALLPTLLSLLLMWFVEVHHSNQGSEKKFLDAFSLTTLSIAAYLMVIIIGENVVHMGSGLIVSLIVLLILLASPVAIVMKAQKQESMTSAKSYCHERTPLIDDSNISKVSEQKTYNEITAGKTCIKGESSSLEGVRGDNLRDQFDDDGSEVLQRGDDFSPLQVLCKADFWLLFVSMACGMGSGLATVNNISQIGGSLGYSSLQTSTLVSLWSIWNFLGRFGAGYVSDCCFRTRGCPRPLFITLTLAMMSIGHAVIASGVPWSLYIGSVLVGVCYGSQWALMPSITSEIFGLRHFGTIFNTIAIASPFGSYILSVRVVGYIYDLESSVSATGLRSCTGRHCFMLSFLIMASVTLVGSAIAFTLFYRTRRFYKQVLFAKLCSSVE